jgi:hypothetical protein
MKALKIKVIESKSDECIRTLLAKKIDASKHITVINESESFKEHERFDWLRLPFEIDHFNVVEGLITIYYSNGYEMEISRVDIPEFAIPE